MSGPLAGKTVIELASIGPVPFCCMMLADMGARVIRIDRKPSVPGSGFEASLRNDSLVDRGRQSIAIDLRNPKGSAVVMDLLTSADILVEGFRPGVAERLGFGPEPCMAHNKRLIYGRMTGWGQNGPLAKTAGHDLTYLALTGALHAMGRADAPPMPPLNLVGDYGGGGMLLAVGILAALVERASSVWVRWWTLRWWMGSRNSCPPSTPWLRRVFGPMRARAICWTGERPSMPATRVQMGATSQSRPWSHSSTRCC